MNSVSLVNDVNCFIFRSTPDNLFNFDSYILFPPAQDAGAETVITADQAVRGGRLIELKKTVDQAVEKCPTVKRVFVYERTGAKVSLRVFSFLT